MQVVRSLAGSKNKNSITCLLTLPDADGAGEALLGTDLAGALYKWQPFGGRTTAESPHVAPSAVIQAHDKEASDRHFHFHV